MPEKGQHFQYPCLQILPLLTWLVCRTDWMFSGTFHSGNFLGCEPRSTVRLLRVLVGVVERRILTLLTCLVRSACLPNGFPQPGTSQTTGTRALLCVLRCAFKLAFRSNTWPQSWHLFVLARAVIGGFRLGSLGMAFLSCFATPDVFSIALGKTAGIDPTGLYEAAECSWGPPVTSWTLPWSNGSSHKGLKAMRGDDRDDAWLDVPREDAGDSVSVPSGMVKSLLGRQG